MLQRKYTCNLGETVKELEQFPCMEGQLLVMYVSRLYASMQTQLDIFLGKKKQIDLHLCGLSHVLQSFGRSTSDSSVYYSEELFLSLPSK